jgi:hypothetical protein
MAWGRTMKIFILTISFITVFTAANAELFKCGEWTNRSLSHRGEVVISISKDALEWRADHASSTAHSIHQSGMSAAYVDKTFVYFVFGMLLWDVESVGLDGVTGPILIRRVPFVSRNPRISELVCE